MTTLRDFNSRKKMPCPGRLLIPPQRLRPRRFFRLWLPLKSRCYPFVPTNQVAEQSQFAKGHDMMTLRGFNSWTKERTAFGSDR
jgi:hypothetical protein